ncbi:MAG: dehydrogenase subunit [Bacteroidetes bacterium]|jgi:NADH-quinone oxidoreductase subunit K|nr:dehydrogenase subunit [Bacteroidota bacterium]
MGSILENFTSGIIPMEAYIFVSFIMFFSGIYGFLSRKSLLMVLISIELILNSADINFAVFNRYLYPEHFEGFFFAMFTIAISACETAVAIAIVINIYRNLNNVEVDSLDELKEPEASDEK